MTTESIEKSRLEFEEWCDMYGINRKRKDGLYIRSNTSKLWFGWLARQESLVVELPPVYQCDGSFSLTGYDVDELKESLKSAGINYTERE